MSSSPHSVRFPGESPEYRAARDELLAAEIELRRKLEAVAAQRRALPVGGEVSEDYAFTEAGPGGKERQVRLSELFAPDHQTLVPYSFMYGPEMEEACPYCTSILDGLDGASPHVNRPVSFAVVAKSPLPRILAHARDRGWQRLRLLSSAGNTYNRDYQGEDANGDQTPALNVFTNRGGKQRHTYNTEMLFVRPDPGQDPRHVDLVWPVWSLLDFTPEGRGH